MLSRSEHVVARDEHTTLFFLPLEILEQILLFCHPRDVAHFSRSCHFASHLVYHSADQYFWRQLFLSCFDDPRHHDPIEPSSFDWKGKLISRMQVERAALTAGPGGADRQSALQTLVSVTQQVLPMAEDAAASLNVEWLNKVLRNSRILEEPFLPKEAPLAHRLLTILGLSLKEETEDNFKELQELRTRSRCFVYNLENNSIDRQWGPYLNGEVNWAHTNYIINIIISNLREHASPHILKPPYGLEAARAYSAPGGYSANDWAGVEGTWRRYVCFMDYRALFAFNFAGATLGGPLNPAFFDNPDFREATRLIEMRMHLIPREKMRIRFPINDPPANTHPDYPTLYFSGSTRGGSMGQHAVVQGFVYMDMQRTPRWRFTSIHNGDPQWSSEGVQIGSVGSAMGVCGVWSAFMHRDEDPAGPFWAWKVSA